MKTEVPQAQPRRMLSGPLSYVFTVLVDHSIFHSLHDLGQTTSPISCEGAIGMTTPPVLLEVGSRL